MSELFTGKPLEVRVGDIVVETKRNVPVDLTEENTYYWVVYKVPSEGNPFRVGCHAYDLENADNIIGPIVFRPTKDWEYRILRYD